jgi:hypothetical protein
MINDKQSLEAAALNWMARTDITPNIADCIQLAEAYFNRRLRVRQMENVVTITPTDGSLTLPADYLAWRRLTWLGVPNVDLEFVVPSVLTRLYPTEAAGNPSRFTIEAQFINVRPIDSIDCEFNYYSKIAPLNDPTDSNWLLDAYPDLYLAGTLAWVNTLVQNQEQFQLWLANADSIIERAMLLSEKGKAPSAIVNVSPTP